MRRWLRRDPPHLHGRVPVDCTGLAPSKWEPPPDEVGRAEIRRAADLGTRKTYDPDTHTLTVAYEETAAGREALRRHLYEDASRRVYASGGLLLPQPGMAYVIRR